MRLVVATRNPDKLREIRQKLRNLNIEVLSVGEFEGVPEVEEDGETLEENALKKARVVAEATGLPAIADDTGLEVYALGGAPGVYSARFAGDNATYADNNRKLLALLKGKEDRRARFRCVIAYVDGDIEELFEGVLEGEIIESLRGENGFGYDPVFYVPSLGRTLAELSREEKNEVSHRGRALDKLVAFLESRGVAQR